MLDGSSSGKWWVAIDFYYDWMGRRIGKVYQTSTSDPATSGGKYGPPILWLINRDTRYVYDGWMLSMSYKTTGSSLEDQSFAWGPDLSSSYGGAGGIGGLVAYSDDEHDALNPAPTDPDFLGPMFPIYDGNGNVVKMIRFESLGGSPEVLEARESASYEYGPFGENRSTTGELGAPASGGTHQGQRNPFRFSTKYTDAETGLVYYGYRYYSANLGRWISRDPIQESDSANLFGMVNNDPINQVDMHGLYAKDFHFSAIYYLFKARCYPDHMVESVAYCSQAVDNHPETDPLRLGRWVWWLGPALARQSINDLRDYHFWESSPSRATVRNPQTLRQRVRRAIRNRDMIDAGRWLHTYADSWAHEGFTAWPNDRINRRTSSWLGAGAQFIGHADAAEEGHAPDNPHNAVGKALQAAFAIYDLIGEYNGKDRPCNCKSLPRWRIRTDFYRRFSEQMRDEETRYQRFNALISVRFGPEPTYINNY